MTQLHGHEGCSRLASNISGVRRLIPYLRPWRRYAIWAFVLSLLIALLNLPMPFFTRFIIDKVLPEGRPKLLDIVVAILLALLLVRSAASYLNSYFVAVYRESVIMHIRLLMFTHIVKQSMAFFANNNPGYLISRVGNDTARVQGLLADTLISLLTNALTFLVGLCAMFYLNAHLAFVALIPLPFIIAFQCRYSHTIGVRSEKVQEEIGNVFGAMAEIFSGIHIVKSFSAEKRECLRMFRLLRKQLEASLKFARAVLTSGTAAALVGSAGPLLIMLLGIREVMEGSLTLGSYIAFTAFVSYLYGPAQAIVNSNVSIQDALVALKRVYEILDLEGEDFGSGDRWPLTCARGEIEFENVSFRHSDAGPFCLRNVSFKLWPGHRYGFVGRSGSGKSTLVGLLCKLYDPDEGSIYVDGQNIAQVNTRCLRKAISLVPQDAFLFSGTIRENIGFGRTDATDQEITEAARLADINMLLEYVVRGNEMQVGYRGMKLSGGEKQRIAIARAILKEARILIMDEATSEIDSRTEALIEDALELLMRDKTTIIISHRLSTIRKAERIFFLDNGALVAQGTHEELYSSIWDYRQLFNRQLQPAGFKQQRESS